MKYHLIAAGGTGMGALAGLLQAAGHEVRGSDTALYPPMSDQLEALKIPIADGFSAENLAWQPDRVIVGNTCSKDHPEVVAAQEAELALTSMPAVLAEEFLAERHSIVIAGTHGKTTTASLIAHILMEAGRDPGYFIGGVPIGLGHGWRLGGGNEFVIEGDEYDSAFFDKKSKFLHYRPRTVVLTSVELDHVDIFSSMDEVRNAFAAFLAMIPEDGLLIVAASSEEALELARKHARCRIETYAYGERGDANLGDDELPVWRSDNIEASTSGRCAFDLTRGGEPVGRFESVLFGEYNSENVTAAVAVALSLDVPVDAIRRGVASFAGVRRRQEVRGIAQGVFVIDDYAHHPTAIAATLQGVRRRFPGRRILAVYEPRSATSRRRTFQHEFIDAFMHADVVVVGRLYAPDKIPEEERFDPQQLALDLHQRGTTASYNPEVDDIVRVLSEQVRPGEVVVVFSSGSFDGLHDKLLAQLGDAVTPAQPGDISPVRELLEETGLDWHDLRDEDYANFLVLRNEDGLAGCIGLEIYGDEGILRSLAVRPAARGHGYGWMLAETLIAYARHRGVKRLYLLTPETASDFFAEKLGFRVVDLSTVSEAVANSSTFRNQRGRSPMTMRLDL